MNRSSSSSSIAASAAAASSSKPHQTQYEVFLSFRGEDTRTNFTSHIYAALCQKGIYTFLDDDKLERGKFISPELLKAIESSCCSVIVISENYASSSWCLDELVKILECREAFKQIVLPIFYHVDPSHVRKQIGSIRKAFQRHEQVFSHDLEKVQSWRDALTQVSNLAGWHLHDRDEAKFIQDFITEVSCTLGVAKNISDDLFGMNSRLKNLNFYVCPSLLDNVRFIGICGMGGIGKTTLARTYYEWMSSQFECCSFLANVREVCEKKKNGLVYLQNLLLSDILNGLPRKSRDVHEGKNMIRSRLCHKQVLIVFDDVDKLDQLKALAEKDNWFGSGSRIIVTTRDESLLKSTYIDCTIYRAEQLNDSEGLQLFAWKAFKSSYPSEDYTELSKQVIAYAKGLPLALEVLGSFLCGKTINEWKSALDKLKEYPKKEIVKVLQITFDGLEETEKNIFLDIACFFNGFNKDEIIQIMDRCGFYGSIGIRNLIDKSLICNGHDNVVWMHDLLQEMGKEIVREISRKEPGKWSRLWDCNDLCHILENNTGTEEVEAIVCTIEVEGKELGWQAFSNMKKLRLLFIHNYNYPPFQNWIVNLGSEPIAYLSNELRILSWIGFPFISFPSSFQPDGLVELILENSNIEQLWNNSIKPLHNLKIIDLSGSDYFSKFEDFGVVPNLEKLILVACLSLVEVHPSITLLKRLTLLNLNSCRSLKSLPSTMNGLESLKVLKISNCTKLRSLPESVGHLNSLEEIDVGRSSLTDLPYSFVFPKNLRILYCGPQSFNMMLIIVRKVLISSRLYSLKELDLSECSLRDATIPEDFGFLACLEELNLSDNHFSYLPGCFKRLTKLRNLDLSDCKKLTSLGGELPRSLEMVKVDYCSSLVYFMDPLNDRCNLRCSASCNECFKLVMRQGSKRTAFASLKRYLQKPPNPSRRFDILLPGREIPAWFTHRSFGPSFSLELDPNWCSSTWMGFAFSVFQRTNLIDSCRVRIDGQELGFGVERPRYDHFFDMTNHLWLFYVSRDIYFQTKRQYNCSTRIEVTFGDDDREGYKINDYGCGVRLVYEQDIQDLNLHYEDDDEVMNDGSDD